MYNCRLCPIISLRSVDLNPNYMIRNAPWRTHYNFQYRYNISTNCLYTTITISMTDAVDWAFILAAGCLRYKTDSSDNAHTKHIMQQRGNNVHADLHRIISLSSCVWIVNIPYYYYTAFAFWIYPQNQAFLYFLLLYLHNRRWVMAIIMAYKLRIGNSQVI